MFQTLPASVIESLAVVLTEKVFPPKAVVFYQGNEVEDLFFIQRGHIKVTSHRCLGTARLGPDCPFEPSQPGTSLGSANRLSGLIASWLEQCTPGSSDERVHVLLCHAKSVTGSNCLRRKFCRSTTDPALLCLQAPSEAVRVSSSLQLADMKLSWVYEETAAIRPITAFLSFPVHSIIPSGGSTATKPLWFCTDGERDRDGVHCVCQKGHHHAARH